MFLEIDEGFRTHRKTLRLCSLMHDPKAGWHMIELWTWACRSCPTGDLTGLDAFEIEEAAKYPAHDGKLCAAMIEARFIDKDESGKPIALHNWMKRTGGAIEKMEKAAERKREYRASRPWEAVRLEVLERDHRTCTKCGKSPQDDSDLQVHHKIPLRKFENKAAANNLRNLTTLCLRCHAAAEKEYRDAEKADERRPEGGDETGGAASARRDMDGTLYGEHSQDKTSPVQSRDPDPHPPRDPATTKPVAPSTPDRPTPYAVVRRYLEIRAQVIGGSVGASNLFAQPQRSEMDKAAPWLEAMAPDEVPDIEPAITLACKHAAAGDPGWTHPAITKAGFLLGAIITNWRDLREELHGCAPKATPAPLPSSRQRWEDRPEVPTDAVYKRFRV